MIIGGFSVLKKSLRHHILLLQNIHMEKSQRAMVMCHLHNQNFLHKQNLNYHINTVHRKVKNFACKICDKRFSSGYSLKEHMHAKHSTSDNPLHSCDKCGHKTHYRSNFVKHIEMHNIGEKWQSCYFCLKKFYRFSRLVAHIRMPTLEI